MCSEKNKSCVEEQEKRDSSILALLRAARVEINEALHTIRRHLAGEIDIRKHLPELVKTKSEIDNYLDKQLKKWCAECAPCEQDTYQEIINLWQQCAYSGLFSAGTVDPDGGKQNGKPDNGAADVAEKQQAWLKELNFLRDRLEEIVYLIAYVTMPERLQDWVDGTRPGYALPIHKIFEDEIASSEKRTQIINLMSLEPLNLKGALIDPIRGVALCYPRGFMNQLARFVLVVALLAVSFVAVFHMVDTMRDIGLSWLGISKPEEILSSHALMFCWLALLLGMVIHLLVGGAKIKTNEFWQFPMPLGNWWFYISARTSVLLYKIVLALVVFVAMFISAKGEIKLLDAFLIGYSFDSVIEILTASIDKQAAAKMSAYKEKLA